MQRLTILTLRHPRAAALLLLALTLFLGSGLPEIRTEFGYRVLIGDDHPSIQTLDRFIQQFGGGAPLTIAWECGPDLPCRSVFDDASLTMAESLRASLESLDVVARIDGPSHSPLLVPDEFGFATRRFIESQSIAPDRDHLAELALSDPLWVGTLISEDGLVGAIHVQASDTVATTESRLVEAVRDALAPHESRGFRFHLVGDSIATIVAGVALAESMGRLIPLLVVAIGLVIALLTRSVTQTLASLATMGVALLWTFGLLGKVGWPQDGILEALAPLVLTVGVCDAIHLLSVIRWREEESSEQALVRAAADVAPACTLTTLTTVAAFLSFATSDLETFVRFGCMSAFSVVCCLVLTFSMLPLLCTWLRIEGASQARMASERWVRALGATISSARRRAGPILVAAVVVVSVSSFGWLARLEVDNDWLESLGEDSDVTRWVRFVEQRLRDSEFLEIEVAPEDAERVGVGAAISVVDRLGVRLEDVPGLGASTSIAEYVKRLNRLMHDDSPAFEKIPGDTRATAELVELLTFGDSSLLDPWMTPDRSRFRISVESPLRSFSSRKAILQGAREKIDATLPPGWESTVSGVLAINHDWVKDIQSTQLKSFPTAFGLVLAIVALFFRSLRLGLVAMIPALLPVVVTLGAMGWMEMSLDVGRAMIAVVIIGIAVDDSIHLLSQFRLHREQGHRPTEAMRRAVAHVGRAIVTTSLALAIGFLTLMLSAWQTISSFGFFVALAILGALAATLFVVPALIFFFDRSESVSREHGVGAGVPEKLRRPSTRTLLTLAALGPAAIALSLAGYHATSGAPLKESQCWLLPTGTVALLPGEGCALPPHAGIRGLRWEGQPPLVIETPADLRAALQRSPPRIEAALIADSHGAWMPLEVRSVPLRERLFRLASAAVAAGLLLWLPLVLVRGAKAPAALPFVFFYSALSVVAITVLAARESVWLNRAALLATTLGPAILVHLSLTFPRVRQVASESPGLLAFPYVLSLAFFPAAWMAMEWRPLLWPAVVYLLILLSFAAWMVLLAACFFSIRESTSPVERARARFLLWTALVVPFGCALLVAREAPSPIGSLATFLAFSVAWMPLPIGIAVGRYNLFNLQQDLRVWTARLVFSCVAACVITAGFSAWAAYRGVFEVGRLPLLFSFSLVSILLLEVLRRQLLGWMEGLLAPRLDELRRAQVDYVAEMAQLRGEEGVARLLGETLQATLAARWGCVLVSSRSGWRRVHGFGEHPRLGEAVLEEAWAALGDDGLKHVVQGADEGAQPSSGLEGLGVELLAAIPGGSERLGLVMLSGRRDRPYSGGELDFVSTAVAHAAMALRNARTAGTLVAAEREAATGRTALALAHSVTKDIGLIRTLARRIGLNGTDRRRRVRDVATLQDLSQELEESVRSFVSDATRERPGRLTLGEAVEQAVRSVSRVHGDGRVSEGLTPSLRGVGVHEGVEHVLTNLLENALLASRRDEVVRLCAVTSARGVAIEVADRGCGMDAEQRRDAFELGYTTRRKQGGFGVGLAVSRDIAEGLGGTLDLSPNPRGGTIATFHLPVEG